MARSKAVVIRWLKIPANLVLGTRPEHKVEHHFAGERIYADAVFSRINPLKANPDHYLDQVW